MNEKKEDFLTHSRKLTQAASKKNITYEQWAEEVWVAQTAMEMKHFGEL